MLGAFAISFVLCTMPLVPVAEKVVKETFGAGGRNRTYYLLVPDKATPDAQAPLLLLLHGSGRDGRSLLDPWLAFAKEHGIVLVAPESNNRQGWSMREDGPDFLYSLVEMIRVQHPIDARRLYLFGHSCRRHARTGDGRGRVRVFRCGRGTCRHAAGSSDSIRSSMPGARRRLPSGSARTIRSSRSTRCGLLRRRWTSRALRSW